MSYNITRWRTKEMTDFRILWEDLTDLAGDDDIYLRKDGSVSVSITEGDIVGQRYEEWFVPTDFEMWGTWSGHGLCEMEEIVFPNSKGRLVASIVWESGDSIQRMTVEDGKTTFEEIDI